MNSSKNESIDPEIELQIERFEKRLSERIVHNQLEIESTKSQVNDYKGFYNQTISSFRWFVGIALALVSLVITLGLSEYVRTHVDQEVKQQTKVFITERIKAIEKDNYNTQYNIGGIYAVAGSYLKALEFYETSLLTAKRVPYDKGEIEALVSIGGIHENMGDLSKADSKYKEAYQKAERVMDIIAKANVLNSRAALSLARHKYDDAESYLNNAKGITEGEASEEAKKHHAGTLQLQGYLSYVRAIVAKLKDEETDKHFNSAIELYKLAKYEREANQDRSGQIAIIRDIGKVHFMKGEYTNASKKYEDSLKVSKEIGDVAGEAASRGELGRLISKIMRKVNLPADNQRKALEELEQARSLYADNQREALEELERARSLYEKIRNAYGEAVIDKYFGDYWLDQGDNEKAKVFYKKSIDEFNELGAVGAVEFMEAKNEATKLEQK